MWPVTTLELANEIHLDGGEGCKCSEGCGGAEDTVEVHTGPDSHRVAETEEDEREDGEAQGELGCYPAEDVVVPLVRGWLAAVGCEEEGAHVAAEVCEVLASEVE